MTSETVPKRLPWVRRIVPSVLGVFIGITALAAFLEGTQILDLEAIWPAIGRAFQPLDEWRQISSLLLVAWAIALQFLWPKRKQPQGLAIRQGLEDADTRTAEKCPQRWMLLLFTGFVGVWIGLLELLSRRPISPEGRVLLLASAVVIQSAFIIWLILSAGNRRKTLIEDHRAAEQMRFPGAARALLTPGMALLLGVGALGLWVGLLLAVSDAWPQMLGLPAVDGQTSLLATMSLAVDEVLDTVFFGIPALYGLVLGEPQPHSWIGATILLVFRGTVAASLILLFYDVIQARRSHAGLIGRVLCESSEEASETLARMGWPTARQLVRQARRLRAPRESDPTSAEAKARLLQAMYAFYHPRILTFALHEAMNDEACDSDRVEALKYVCTYGDPQAALDLMGKFFHSGNANLRAGVSLICVVFEHPDCNTFLEEIGEDPYSPDEYRNAVIGAGVRLRADLRDSAGLSACLKALPCILRAADDEAPQMLEGISLLASFAAQEVKAEIQLAWPEMAGATKLHCLNILLKIRAGLLPDPELLAVVLSNTESRSDKMGIGQLWRFMTQAGVASLVEIARSPDPLARDGALATLSQLRAKRPDLTIDAALLANMMAPTDESDNNDSEVEPPEAEATPEKMSPAPETYLVSV